MAKIDLVVPDIGNFDDVDIIEIPVNVGDVVDVEQTLLTLESDKASMDVPAEQAGKIVEILVKVGDKIKEGDIFARIETADGQVANDTSIEEQSVASAVETQAEPKTAENTQAPVAANNEGSIEEIRVPDIGNFDDVDVIEVLVSVGDEVELDQTLVTLESDKASMDVPADKAGRVTEILAKVGDKIKEGDVIVKVMVGDKAASAPVTGSVAEPTASKTESSQSSAKTEVSQPAAQAEVAAVTPSDRPVIKAPHDADPFPAAPKDTYVEVDFTGAHASPSVRAFARELGADLTKITGTGRKSRILREDVINYVKLVMSGEKTASSPAGVSGSGVGLDLLPWPKVDFSKFGEVESQPLSRIKKISGANLARNWVKIPHVAQFDDADITGLEELRKTLNKEFEREGARVTILAFMVKACVKALQKFPEFNSSLEGDNLILKKYYHIGFAADTPNGLVVPVIRDCDKKGVLEIAKEMGELAGLAREGKLKPEQMQGGCFTISSLGGIGGTNFIPIINAPEVAILGVARSSIQPVWNGKEFEPRLMQPLALSYDHRVIDGALAARFIVYLSQLLTDMRRALI